jgi:hypothetical protein
VPPPLDATDSRTLLTGSVEAKAMMLIAVSPAETPLKLPHRVPEPA